MYKRKKIICFVYARVNSTRLRNKLLKKINKETIIEKNLKIINKINYIDDIFLLTTNKKNDNSLIKICKFKNIKTFRGSENNLIKRTNDCINEYNLKYDYFVRYCCDNPLTSIKNIEKGLRIAIDNNFDIVSCAEHSNLVSGTSQVIIKKNCFKKILYESKDKKYKEHIENYCYDNHQKFNIHYINSSKKNYFNNLSLTLDNDHDFKRITKIYKNYKFSDGKFNIYLLKKNFFNNRISISRDILKLLGNTKNKYNITERSNLKISYNENNYINAVYFKKKFNYLEIIYKKYNKENLLFIKKFKNIDEAKLIFLNLLFTIVKKIYFEDYHNIIDLDKKIQSKKILYNFLPYKRNIYKYFPKKIVSDFDINKFSFIKNNKIDYKEIKKINIDMETLYIFNNNFYYPYNNYLKKFKKFNINEISETWQSYEYSSFRVDQSNL